MRVFSAWLMNTAQVQENMRLQIGSTSDKARTKFTRDKTKSTSFAAISDSSFPTRTQCLLKNGELKIWQGEKFKKKQPAERHEIMEKYSLFFSCLSTGHRISQCKSTNPVAKMVAVSVTGDFCTVTTKNWNCKETK